MTTAPPTAPPSREDQHARLLALFRELEVGSGAGLKISHRSLAAALNYSPWHWSKIANGHFAPVSAHPPYSRWRSWEEFEAALRQAARVVGATVKLA